MQLDRNSEIPIYLQIYNYFRDEIIDGYLIAKERLPSRRGLARELGIAERTVENAYYKLVADGYVVPRKNSGYFVSSERVWDDEEKQLKSIVYNFSSNGVETSKLPFSEWARLLKNTVKDDTGLFQHGEKAGEWCLRKSIRRMLFRTQGIKCKTDNIVIGPGAEDLIRELFLLLAPTHSVLMNNCYNYRVLSVAKTANVKPVFIRDDECGADIDLISGYKSALLYCQPTHSLPAAVTLTQKKRLMLAEWAKGGNYIIEDASENDYQYNGRAETIHRLADGGNVIYLGSFSKTIAPSIKIGYLVMPEELVRLWFEKKQYYSNRVSRIEQVTLSKFIDLGHYERHLDYMRSVYREKARALRRAIEASPLGRRARISGDDTGMFCRIAFDLPADEDTAFEELLKHGLKASVVNYSIGDRSISHFPGNSYSVGYGNLTITEIKDGINAWAKAWKQWL